MGGYVAAVALRAMGTEARARNPTLRPATLTCQFLGVGYFDAADVSVDVRVEGRTSAVMAAAVTQNGRAVLDAQAWFCTERDVLEHDAVSAPDVADPEELPSLDDVRKGAAPFPFWDNLEGRALSWMPPDEWAVAAPGPPVWQEWLAFRPDPDLSDPLVDASRLVILADLPSWPAAHRAHPGESGVVAPNLDLAVQFHRFEPGCRWLLCHGSAPVAERGLIGFGSQVFSRDRRLLASGAGQLRCRSAPTSPADRRQLTSAVKKIGSLARCHSVSSPSTTSDARLGKVDYLSDDAIAGIVYLADRLGKPVLVEGPAGTGKTQLAKSVAEICGARLIRLQCYEGLDESKALYEWNYKKQLLRIQAGRSEGDGSSWDEIEENIFSDDFLLTRPLLEAIRAEDPVVLLIDEVDRVEVETEALLLEILSDYQVSIPELGTIEARQIPLVFLTSNNTRELSEALKRRCLFLHIDYPDIEREREIVLTKIPDITESLADQVARIVRSIRRWN